MCSQEQLAHAENQITMAKSHKAHYEGKLKSHMKTIGELKKKQETYLNELKVSSHTVAKEFNIKSPIVPERI